MSEMFQRRPPVVPWDGVQKIKAAGMVNGEVHWVAQNRLVFGSDAKKQRGFRPVVVISFEVGRTYVLPATSAKKNGYFHVKVNDCPRTRRFPGLSKDGHVSKWVEAIARSDIEEQLCKLTDQCRARLAGWMRENLRPQIDRSHSGKR